MDQPQSIAAATVGYSLWEPNVHRACHDNFTTMGRTLEELARRGYTRIGFAAPDQAILLLGAPDWWGTHLGQSIYLRDLFGRKDGPPPPVDAGEPPAPH